MVIRGRQARRGITGMSLSTFLDLVWVEIWDDVPPMGDKNVYRSVITQAYIEGKEPYDITWEDHDGNLKRLADSPSSNTTKAKSARQVAAEWHERLRESKKPDDVDSGAS